MRSRFSTSVPIRFSQDGSSSGPRRRRSRARIALATSLFVVGFLCPVQAQGQSPDDARAIRSLLADACSRCHGPDPDTREARLRLDRSEDLFDTDRHIVVPGDPDRSELIRRIRSTDPDEVMPPPSAGRTLDEDQIARLVRWVEDGAAFPEHWAFVPPVAVDPPTVRDEDWPRRSLDRFVMARWEAEGIRGTPEADAGTLVRRLFLDLIGLPPTLEELARWKTALESDERTGETTGYEQLVDSLLASPHYGERWARPWLDLARYADTNGYEKDRERSIWPYRDWVVEALNADMPYDQFTVEQLAGDLLPNATTSQRIATGFHRNSMLNEEGGIDPLEFRYLAMVDRVATTGTTWLGMTFSCAQCHTHKFDPLTQREYFQSMAFLDNADEPELELPDSDGGVQRRTQAEEATRRLRELERAWFDPESTDENTAASREASFQGWLAAQRQDALSWRRWRPTTARSPTLRLQVEDDAAVYASGDSTKDDQYELVFRSTTAGVRALRLEALADPRLPARGPGLTYYEGTRGDFFLGEITVQADGVNLPLASATHSYAKNRFGGRGVGADLALDGDPQTGWSVDGRIGERHVAVFQFAEPLPELEEVTVRLRFGRHFASSLGRLRISATSAIDPKARDLPEVLDELLRAPREPDSETKGLLREEYLLQIPELREETDGIRPLQRGPSPVTTLVFSERPVDHPRSTHLRHRGEYLQPRERTTPATPEFLHPFADTLRRDRLGFAQWLVSPRNPLIARVAVNRIWAAFFGEGIVRTLDDFGIQGAPPTHPELLDWLAVAFVENGWSLKWLQREIVCSATYRQDSAIRPELLETDPDNRLLTRLPRLRLEGERIRDAALVAAGLLERRLGGPPVRPPQAEGVTEVTFGSPRWQASDAPDRHRRSLYTFAKRTAPFALYKSFGAPSGEHCTARRVPSNTPLQALALLNDIVFQECAAALAGLLIEAGGDDDHRLDEAALRTLGRTFDDEERLVLRELIARQRARISSGDLDAVALVRGHASAEPEPTAPELEELALWTAVARTLLALDEAVTRN